MFSYKKVLVTGGSSGIGKALVDQLLDQGCQVFSLSRTLGEDQVYSKKGLLHPIACDITDKEALDRAFEAIYRETDSLDLVFSNAGFGISGALVDTPKDQVVRQFDVNLFSAVDLIQRSLPLLEKAGGRIILTSSVAAVVSLPFQSFYSASKASLNMLALALNTELKPFGIRTVAVMPGDVSSSFTDNRQKDVCPASPYGQRCQASVARMEEDERQGTSPQLTARRIIRIASKSAPKALYGLGFSYRLVLLVFKVFPVRFTNWIVGLLYG